MADDELSGSTQDAAAWPASWFASRAIIAPALAEREGRKTVTHADLAFASAVIARLAHHEPPLLIDFAPLE